MSDFGAIARLSVLLVRPGMLAVSAPFLGAVYAPAQVRVGLTVLLAVILAPAVPVPPVASTIGLTVVIAREMAIGLAIGLSVRVIVAGAEVAGQLSGYQTGLSSGAMVDPQSGVRNPLIAALYGNLTVFIGFATNAHHAMLRALVSSYTALPIGTGGVSERLAGAVARTFGLMIVMGLRLAAPLIIVLLLVELALGLMARVAPSLNLMAIGAPLRVVIGMLLVAVTVSSLPSLVARFWPLAFELAADTARAFR